jgi:hypothetical protein
MARMRYRARYALSADGSWTVRVRTELGDVRVRAARLSDIERRAYDVVRQQTGLPSAKFDIDFAHEIDLTALELQLTA